MVRLNVRPLRAPCTGVSSLESTGRERDVVMGTELQWSCRSGIDTTDSTKDFAHMDFEF